MLKLKPHLSVEQIAKKHRLDVSFIQKQLDMGEPIEHEHTKDHTLAMDIALQHLDEIPDYYTRLKKMEASAKKEHKKFKDVKEDSGDGNDDMDIPLHSVHIEYDKRYCTKCKEVQLRSKCKYGPKCWDIFSIPEKLKEETMHKEQRYCPLCDKKETRSECSYGEKAWDKVSIKEESILKVRRGILKGSESQIKRSTGAGALTPQAAKQLGDKAVELQMKKAAAVSLPKIGEEKLVDKILGELQEEDPCWKGYTQVGMKKKEGKPVPNCVPSKGVPKAKGYKEEIELDEARKKIKINTNKPIEWKIEDLGPNKTVVKTTTSKGYKEDVTIEDANGKLYAEVIDLIKPEPIVSPKSTFMAYRNIEEATRLQSETGNIIAVILSWRGKTYSIRMFFPQIGMPSKKDITFKKYILRQLYFNIMYQHFNQECL